MMSENEEQCSSCKPTDKFHEYNSSDTILFQGKNDKCLNEYTNVDKCMKKYNGSVVDCQTEWTIFRKCFENKNSRSG